MSLGHEKGILWDTYLIDRALRRAGTFLPALRCPDGAMPHPGLNSMNHYANGSIGDWMYRKIGGTNQLEAGYHRFYVKPQFVRGIKEARTELRFTLDSTLGEIMKQPLGKQMPDQMVPELMANPMIEYAKKMTLAEGISSAPDIRAVYEAVLQALNEQG